MKKIFISIFIILFYAQLFSQITLDQTWNYGVTTNYAPFFGLGKVTFTDYGEKFYWTNDQGSGGDSIWIFNYDGSLFKQIALPDDPYYGNGHDAKLTLAPLTLLSGNYAAPSSITSISDRLFNNDSLIEVLAKSTAGSTLYVVNELGNVVYEFDSANSQGALFLFDYNNNYKMAFATSSDITFIYSLPGSIPCNTCSIISGINEPGSSNANGLSEMNAYPNPFTGKLNISYQLASHDAGSYLSLTTVDGRELIRKPIISDSNSIILETTNLPRGVIIAAIYESNGNLVAKKLVK